MATATATKKKTATKRERFAEVVKRTDGMSAEPSSYEPEQVERALNAPAELSGKKLRDYIMKGPQAQKQSGRKAASKPEEKPDDPDRIDRIREQANAIGEVKYPLSRRQVEGVLEHAGRKRFDLDLLTRFAQGEDVAREELDSFREFCGAELGGVFAHPRGKTDMRGAARVLVARSKARS